MRELWEHENFRLSKIPWRKKPFLGELKVTGSFPPWRPLSILGVGLGEDLNQVKEHYLKKEKLVRLFMVSWDCHNSLETTGTPKTTLIFPKKYLLSSWELREA